MGSRWSICFRPANNRPFHQPVRRSGPSRLPQRSLPSDFRSAGCRPHQSGRLVIVGPPSTNNHPFHQPVAGPACPGCLSDHCLATLFPLVAVRINLAALLLSAHLPPAWQFWPVAGDASFGFLSFLSPANNPPFHQPGAFLAGCRCLDTGPCGALALGVPKQQRSGFLPGAASLRNFLSFSSLKSFLISLPYILTYTWEKRDNSAAKEGQLPALLGRAIARLHQHETKSGREKVQNGDSHTI